MSETILGALLDARAYVADHRDELLASYCVTRPDGTRDRASMDADERAQVENAEAVLAKLDAALDEATPPPPRDLWDDFAALPPPSGRVVLHPCPRLLRGFAGYSLSNRGWSALLRLEWATPADLIAGDPEDLRDLPNAGPSTCRELALLRRRLMNGAAQPQQEAA